MQGNFLKIALCCLSLSPLASQATVIVDTGSGSGPNWSLFSLQWLAAEFTLTSAYNISDMEAWLGVSNPGTATIAVYSDGGDLPGSELYSTEANFGQAADGWRGVSGLGWELDAGTYWAAFQVRSGQSFSGYMPGASANALSNHAYWWNGTVYAQDNLTLGVRISEGVVATVAEPTSLALMGLGCMGLAFARRRVGARDRRQARRRTGIRCLAILA